MGHSILITRGFQGMARRADEGEREEETEMMHTVSRGLKALKGASTNIKNKSKRFVLLSTRAPSHLLSSVI